MPTMLDIVKAQGVDPVTGLVEEAITAVPELGVIPMDTIPGQSYPSLIRTALPTVSFRSGNEGSTDVKSTYEPRNVETFILNPTWRCDKAIADVHPHGAATMIAREASGVFQASCLTLCSQMYYGTANDAKGFQGLQSFVDLTNMVVDATGTTGTTATSVWALKCGPGDVQFVCGANGKFALEDVRIGDAYDASNKRFTAYIQELLAWMGLAVLSKWAVGCIKNITTENGKGLTDSLMSQLLEKFPAGHQPDVFVMHRRSRGQLQRSRTATNATGAEAPLPTSYEGIPIIISESIKLNEGIL